VHKNRASQQYCGGCRSLLYHPPHNDASQQVAAIVVVVVVAGLDSALVGHHLGVVGHGTLFYDTLFYDSQYNCYRIYRVSETTTEIVLAIYRVVVVDNNWAAGEATKEEAAAVAKAKLAVFATDGNVQ
jgi:hypothetical protein